MVRIYGGLPLTSAARAAVRSKILQDGNKTLEIAYASMKGRGASSLPHVADADPVRIITERSWKRSGPTKNRPRPRWIRRLRAVTVVLNAKPALKKAQPFRK